MVIFNTEYVPELKWTMVEPRPEKNDVGERTSPVEREPRNDRYVSGTRIPTDRDRRRHNVIGDFQSILNIINLIEKMIKYNNIYYERIEKRKRQQNLELQVLTMFLQNVYNDLKDV